MMPSSPLPDAPHRAWPLALAAALPLLAFLLEALGWLTWRLAPMSVAQTGLLLLPLTLVGIRQRVDPLPVLLLAALVAAPAVAGLIAGAPATSWWWVGVLAAGAGAALALAAAPAGWSSWCWLILGASAAITALAGLAIAGWRGALLPGERPWIGLGNVTTYTVVLGCPLLAALALLGSRRPAEGIAPAWWRGAGIAVAIGLLAWIAVVVTTHRRTGVLMLACAAVGWWIHRRPRPAWVGALPAAAVALGAAAIIVLAPIGRDLHLARGERLQMWPVAVEILQAHPLLGVGGYASLREPIGEAGRTWAASLNWALNFHCTALDVAVAGGLLSLAVLIVVLGLAGMRSAGQEARERRLPAVALWAAVPGLLVDGSWTTPLGWLTLMVVLGLVLAAGAPGAVTVTDGRLPVRLAVWPLALVAAGFAAWGSFGAFLPGLARPAVFQQACARSPDPEIVGKAFAEVFTRCRGGDSGDRRLVADAARATLARLGPVGPTLLVGFEEAEALGDPRALRAAAFAYLDRYPFSTWAMEAIFAQGPAAGPVPERWQAVIAGFAQLQELPPDPGPIRDLDDAVIRWWRAVPRVGADGADRAGIAEVRRIVGRYGHLPDVTIQVLRWAARGPVPAWTWMIEDADLLYAGTNVVGTAAAFAHVHDPQVAGLFIALGRRFPPLTGVLAAADRGEPIPYGPPFEVHEPMQREIVRIHALTRGGDR